MAVSGLAPQCFLTNAQGLRPGPVCPESGTQWPGRSGFALCADVMARLNVCSRAGGRAYTGHMPGYSASRVDRTEQAPSSL
jgi:hypothetical protein